MIFTFNILGILILFILTILYFSEKYQDRYPYKIILLGTYITELLHIVTYIGIKNNNYNLSGRLYFRALVILFSLFSMYNCIHIIKEKYKSKVIA